MHGHNMNAHSVSKLHVLRKAPGCSSSLIIASATRRPKDQKTTARPIQEYWVSHKVADRMIGRALQATPSKNLSVLAGKVDARISSATINITYKK